MSVRIRPISYKGWHNCIELSNGIIDLIVTTEIGPRIIRFGFVGQQNEFCEVEDQMGTTGGDHWKIYGGHRLWHSPEHKVRTFLPDNAPVDYQEIPNGLIVTQPTEHWTHIQKQMKITLSPDSPEVEIDHILTNEGAWSVQLSVWAISVMAKGGKEYMPQVTRETGFLPNRSLSLWPYTKLNDHRVYWGKKYITLQQDPNMKPPFKIGYSNEDGWAAYANNGHVFVKEYKHHMDRNYPDYASSFETYTTDYMLEMESLGPLVLLNPLQSTSHIEKWSLYDNIEAPASEEEIDRVLLPLIDGM